MICIKCGIEKDTAEFIGYPYVDTCRECIIKGAKAARAVNIGAMIFLTLFATLYVFLAGTIPGGQGNAVTFGVVFVGLLIWGWSSVLKN